MTTTAPRLTCICCEASAFRPYRRLRGFDLYRCDECGFVRVHPLPESSAVEAHYNETRTGVEQRQLRRRLLAEFATAPNNPKRDFFDEALTRSRTLVGKASLDILEVGSGLGYFVQYANSLGHRATGTEATRAYAELSSEALNGRIVHVESDRYAEHFAPAPPHGDRENHQKQQRRHRRSPNGLRLDLEKPAHLLHIEAPQPDPVESRDQRLPLGWKQTPGTCGGVDEFRLPA